MFETSQRLFIHIDRNHRSLELTEDDILSFKGSFKDLSKDCASIILNMVDDTDIYLIIAEIIPFFATKELALRLNHIETENLFCEQAIKYNVFDNNFKTSHSLLYEVILASSKHHSTNTHELVDTSSVSRTLEF